MRYKKLGKSEMSVSVITVGTWAIGGSNWGEVNKKESIDAIRTMIDNGVNIIDTAPAYGAGYSEEVVGEAVKGMRDKLYITTKFGLVYEAPPGKDGPGRDSTRARVFEECNRSLKRLNTDYIDLYLIHWPDPKTPFEETMTALTELKRHGKIRYIGVSNFDQNQICECEKYGSIDVIQPPYSMVDRSAEDLMVWCNKHNLGIMTYGSLGAGILTGSFRKLPSFAPDDMRLVFYDFFVEPKFSKVMELLKTLDKIAGEHGVPVAQVSINWSTQRPFVDTALMGVRNPQEANQNCAAMKWNLTKEEIDMINKAIDNTVGK